MPGRQANIPSRTTTTESRRRRPAEGRRTRSWNGLFRLTRIDSLASAGGFDEQAGADGRHRHRGRVGRLSLPGFTLQVEAGLTLGPGVGIERAHSTYRQRLVVGSPSGREDVATASTEPQTWWRSLCRSRRYSPVRRVRASRGDAARDCGARTHRAPRPHRVRPWSPAAPPFPPRPPSPACATTSARTRPGRAAARTRSARRLQRRPSCLPRPRSPALPVVPPRPAAPVVDFPSPHPSAP